MFRVALALVMVMVCIHCCISSSPKKDGESWEMPRHSWYKTLSYDDKLGDWYMSSSSIALRDRFMLFPKVAERHALMWNKQVVMTHDFEVSFSFSVRGPLTSERDAAFAFWIDPHNFTALYDEKVMTSAGNWTQGLSQREFTFAGNKRAFHGLGVIFLCLDSTGKYNPSVTGIFNDGKSREINVDVPVTSGSPYGPLTKFFDWRRPAVTSPDTRVKVKIRVKPGQIVAQLQFDSPKGDADRSWVDLFQLPHTVRTGSYVGFTGWSGTRGEGLTSDEVNLHNFEIRNYDSTIIGEDLGVVEDIADIQEWKRLLLVDAHEMMTQKSQTEVIVKLSDMLNAHTKRYTASGVNLQKDLVDMQSRIHVLEDRSKVLKQEIALVFGNSSTGDLGALKDKLKGLKTVLHSEGKAHADKIAAVSQTAQETKKESWIYNPGAHQKLFAAIDKGAQIEKEQEQGSKQTKWMLLILILGAGAFGIIILQRIRKYEKKHFL